MMYQNEFDNLNTMMLESRVMSHDELAEIEPVVMRAKVAQIVKKAGHRLKFAGIGQEARVALLTIQYNGLQALKAGTNEALISFYDGVYRDSINQATSSDYMKARDFNYINDPEAQVTILEQDINEEIATMSTFEEGINDGLGSIENPTMWEKFMSAPVQTKLLVTAPLAYILYKLLMRKKA
jgi:hypothetical protein